MSDQSQESLEKELTALKIQSRSKENIWKKEKAILEQRIELQEIQIAEAKSREENLRRMHETFMDALQGLSTDSNKGQQSRAVKDLKQMLEILQVESETNKTKLQDRVGRLEKEMRDELQEKENELKTIKYQQKMQVTKATQDTLDQIESNNTRRPSSSEENKNNHETQYDDLQTQNTHIKEAIQKQIREEITLKEDIAIKDNEITRLFIALQEAETQPKRTSTMAEHKEKQSFVQEKQQKVTINQRVSIREGVQQDVDIISIDSPVVPVYGIFHSQKNNPQINITSNTHFSEEKNFRSVQERASSSQRQNTNTTATVCPVESRNTHKGQFQDLNHSKQINDLSQAQHSYVNNNFINRNGRAKTSSNCVNKGTSLVIQQQQQQYSQNNPLAGQIVMRNPSKHHNNNNNNNTVRECKSGRRAHSPEYNPPYVSDSTTTVTANSGKMNPYQYADKQDFNQLQMNDHQLLEDENKLIQNDIGSNNHKNHKKIETNKKNSNFSIQYPKDSIISETNIASEGRLKTQPTQRDNNPSNIIGISKAASFGILTKLSGVLSASPRNRVAKIQSPICMQMVGNETYSKSSSAGFQTTFRDNHSKEQFVESQTSIATKFHSPTLSQCGSTSQQQEQLGDQFTYQKNQTQEVHNKNVVNNSKQIQPFNQQSQHLKTNQNLSSNPNHKPLVQLLSPSAASTLSQQFQPASSSQFLRFLSSKKNKENSAALEGISRQLDRNVTGKTEELNQQLYQPRDSKGLIFPNQASEK